MALFQSKEFKGWEGVPTEDILSFQYLIDLSTMFSYLFILFYLSRNESGSMKVMTLNSSSAMSELTSCTKTISILVFGWCI